MYGELFGPWRQIRGKGTDEAGTDTGQRRDFSGFFTGTTCLEGPSPSECGNGPKIECIFMIRYKTYSTHAQRARSPNKRSVMQVSHAKLRL